MDEDKASRFISSLVKSIQALCNGFVDFSTSIEVVGHIHLNIDRSVKLDYVLTEEVSKSVSEGSTVFSSHSYHSQPPPSVASKSASDTSNSQKSRKDSEADPLGLSALPREVPNTSKSDTHLHGSSRVSDSSNSSHSFSGNVGFSRNSDSEKLENNRSSSQVEDGSNKRRKMGPLSQTPSPANKRCRTNDFGPGSRTVVKEPGFEVIEIKEEPEEEPPTFFGSSAPGQDIQTPDFSNVVMESLDRVNQIEQGTDLVGDSGGGEVMTGPQQPVFPVMFHQSDGLSSSSSAPVPGPSSDPQSVASTSGDTFFTNTDERLLARYSKLSSYPSFKMPYHTGYRRYSTADLRKGIMRVLQGETVRKVSSDLKLPRETLRRHVEKTKRNLSKESVNISRGLAAESLDYGSLGSQYSDDFRLTFGDIEEKSAQSLGSSRDVAQNMVSFGNAAQDTGVSSAPNLGDSGAQDFQSLCSIEGLAQNMVSSGSDAQDPGGSSAAHPSDGDAQDLD